MSLTSLIEGSMMKDTLDIKKFSILHKCEFKIYTFPVSDRLLLKRWAMGNITTLFNDSKSI